MLLATGMSTQHKQKQRKDARTPQPSQSRAPVDPASQSPEAPIEFTRGDEAARGNAERANAEPEPAALHDAQVPGKPDAAAVRRHGK